MASFFMKASITYTNDTISYKQIPLIVNYWL